MQGLRLRLGEVESGRADNSAVISRASGRGEPPSTLDRRCSRCYHHKGSDHNPDRRRFAMIPIRYFKRYRMVLDLARPLPPVPVLPDGYFWLPWDDSLVAAHARAKFASFHDGNRQPSVSEPGHRKRLRATNAGDPPAARASCRAPRG